MLDHSDVVEPGGLVPELVLGGVGPELHHQLPRRNRPGRHGRGHGDRVVGLDDLRRLHADHHAVVLGLRERRHRCVADHGADAARPRPPRVQPGGEYPSSCSGAVDPNYTLQLRRRLGAGQPRPADHRRRFGVHDLRGCDAGHPAVVLGLRERRHLVGTVDSFRRARPRRPRRARRAPTPARAQEPSGRTTPSPTFQAQWWSGSAALVISASSGSMTYGGSAPTITPSYSGFVNGDDRRVADDGTDLLDHGHVVEPGGELPELVQRRSRPQLRHHVRQRDRSLLARRRFRSAPHRGR